MMEGEDEMGSQFDQQQAQCKRAGSLFPVFSARGKSRLVENYLTLTVTDFLTKPLLFRTISILIHEMSSNGLWRLF